MVVPIRLAITTRRSGLVSSGWFTLRLPWLAPRLLARSGAAAPDAVELGLGMGAPVGDMGARRPAAGIARGGGARIAPDADAALAVLEEAAGRGQPAPSGRGGAGPVDPRDRIACRPSGCRAAPLCPKSQPPPPVGSSGQYVAAPKRLQAAPSPSDRAAPSTLGVDSRSIWLAVTCLSWSTTPCPAASQQQRQSQGAHQ